MHTLLLSTYTYHSPTDTNIHFLLFAISSQLNIYLTDYFNIEKKQLQMKLELKMMMRY